jgi:ubiquinone biosynthesis protein UbiJ
MMRFLLKPAEQVLNRSLSLSTQAQTLATQLNQKSLAVSVRLHPEAEPIRMRIAIQDQHIALCADQEPASVDVSGSPFALLKFTHFEWTRALVGSTHIAGDAEVAKQFEHFFKALPFDAGGLLAEKIGDQPAYWVEKAAHTGIKTAARVARSLTRQTIEYLNEESGILTSKTRVEVFGENVEALRDDAERLKARLTILEKRFTK